MPQVQLLIVKNGGAPAHGAITADFEDEILLKLEQPSLAKKAKYRIWEFPEGFACPSGWQEDANGKYYVITSSGADAPLVTLPAADQSLAGKYVFDVLVNDGMLNGRATSEMYDNATCLEIPFATGVEDVVFGESTQFDPIRQYARALKKLIRALNAAVVSGGGVTDHGALTGRGDDDHTQYDFAARPVSPYTGPSNAAVLADARKTVTTSHASPSAFVLPTNASVAFATATLLGGINIGAGAVAITGDTGVTVNGVAAGSVSVPQYGWWWAKKTGTNTWYVFTSGGGLVVSGTPTPGFVVKADSGGNPIWAGAAAFDTTAFACTTPTLEVGATATNPAFTAAHNRTPTALTLTNNDNVESKDVHATPTSFTSSQGYTKTTNNASVTFTLTGSDGISGDVATAAIAWRPRVYWGTGASGGNTEAFIEALSGSALQSSRSGSFTVNATGSLKIYWAAPASYGTPTFDVGGFTGGFTLVSNTISVTNAHGVVQNYALYESDTPGLGNTTVVVT